MAKDSSVNPSTGDQAFTRQSDRGTVAEATYAGALSFMRRRYTRDLSSADVAIMGIPFDLAVSSRPGARQGPRAVRAASSLIAWSKPWPWPEDPFEQLSIVDYGDCQFDYGYPAKVPDEITNAARTVLATDTALLSIGGDHFVTYPLLKAHAEKHGPLSLIHFDAHTDTWADEEGRIDHGTMLWHATREGLVDPTSSVQIGIRTHNPEPLGFTIIDAIDVHRTGPRAVAETIKGIVGRNKAYLTFDIDALEPASAPGTGTPVIGGLSPYQAQEILRNIVGVNLVGMDIVEVAPAYDVGEITALAAATLANDMLCLYAANRAREN
ncbi:MAG: agmatinase [Rhodospirillum sp.]|nr:agmatinase [Rhodospirillum sp.]MCF8491192.1 agmatinase [Rhodospirillum sp.]MCF8499612.1 agmatinase [Rhodospirillum sp.]